MKKRKAVFVASMHFGMQCRRVINCNVLRPTA